MVVGRQKSRRAQRQMSPGYKKQKNIKDATVHEIQFFQRDDAPIMGKKARSKRRRSHRALSPGTPDQPKTDCMAWFAGCFAKLNQTSYRCDPYIIIRHNPSNVELQTETIYAGGHHVEFTEHDSNVMNFQVEEPRNPRDLNAPITSLPGPEIKQSLTIEAWDFQPMAKDRLIGKATVGFHNIFSAEGEQNCCVLLHHGPEKMFAGSVDLSFSYLGEGNLRVRTIGCNELREYDVYDEGEFGLAVKGAVVFGVFMVLSATLFHFIEPQWTFLEGMWFAIVTALTVGYGDLYPSTWQTKLFNCFFIIFSVIFVGFCISSMMNHIFAVQERAIMKTNKSDNDMDTIASGRRDLRRKMYWSCLILLTFTFAVSLFYYLYEGGECPECGFKNYVDALHFTIQSISTVGYGEVAPKTKLGKWLGIFFLLFGVSLMTRLATTFMEMVMFERADRRTNELMSRSLVTKEQLFAFDQDGNDEVDKFEFVTRMLILAHEVDPDVLERFSKKFDELDMDGDGTLTREDFADTQTLLHERRSLLSPKHEKLDVRDLASDSSDRL